MAGCQLDTGGGAQLTRPIRIEYPHATYHVMSHGVDGTATFIDNFERKRFLDFLREIVGTGNLLVHAFCLMINHFHMLCETPKSGLSRHMQRLLVKYTNLFNKRHQRRGHLWRARYKAVLVEEGDYFLQCSRYIHLNPVKANICSRPEEYAWSSYRHYLHGDEDLKWVTTDRTLRSFQNKLDYANFIAEGIQNDLKNPFEEAIGGVVFGSRAFANQLQPLVKKPHLTEDMPGVEALDVTSYPSIEEVEAVISQIFPCLTQCQRTRMLVYGLRRFTQMTGRDIAAVAGRCPSMVTHVWQEMQIQLVKNSEFRKRMENVAQLLRKGIG
jgi:putative transposase